MGTVLTNNAEIVDGANALDLVDEDSPLTSTARLVTPIEDITVAEGSETVSITFTVDADFQGTDIVNNAEIESQEDVDGPREDDDSTPGDEDGTTPDPLDDDVDATDGSDDYDPADITVVQEFDLAILDTLETLNVDVTNYLPTGTTLVTGGDFTDAGGNTATTTIDNIAAGDSTEVLIT